MRRMMKNGTPAKSTHDASASVRAICAGGYRGDISRAPQISELARGRYTPREAAEERMRAAKQAMTRAAWAALDGLPEAAFLGDRARAELDEARQDLERCDEA